MAIVPRFLAMGFNNNYFQYSTQGGAFHARIMRTSPMLLSEKNFTKFEVVISNVDRNLIHIRTSYNNKFLRLDRQGGTYLVAEADEPEEDSSKWSCTMFRFDYNSSTRHLGLLLLSQNTVRNVTVFTNACMGVARQTYVTHRFDVTDLRTLVMLPKQVVFKGDNGLYLRARSGRWLEFYAEDPTDWKSRHLAITQNNGNVRLLSTRYNLYWQRLNNNWIRCDGSQGGLLNTVFRPVRLTSQKNTIALLNVDNNMYCERWASGGSANRYRATSATAVPRSVVTVEEAIRDREISDIRYKLNEARTYNMVPIVTVPSTVENPLNETSWLEAKFKYTEVSEETFRSSHTWKFSAKSTINVRVIPILVEGKLELDASYEGKVEWDTTHTESKEVSSATKVPVPPRSRLRVDLIVARGSCDVPYSYKQRDYLLDGTSDVKILEDGLFTGVSTFEVQFIINDPEPLDRSTLTLSELDQNSGNERPYTIVSPSELRRRYHYNDDIAPPRVAISPPEEEEEEEEEEELQQEPPNAMSSKL